MKATEVNLSKFLAQNDTQFIIPVYQRNYDWTKAQCKQLFDDVLVAGASPSTTAHFIGSIVYIHDDLYSSSGISELTIIDGQQRLTTITLIYLSICRIARSLKDEKLENRLMETYLINKFAEDEEKLKLRPTENNDRAFKYLLRSKNQDEFSGFSRLIENYEYLNSRILEENYLEVLKGLTKLMFVEISLDRVNDDPQKIFESLNSTGLELTQADLIRNYILMGLDRINQKRVYERYWEVIENNAKDEATNTNKVSDFIRDFLTVKNNKIPNKNKVYQEFKEHYPNTGLKLLEDTLSEIKTYVKIYNKLINPGNEIEPDIQYHLTFINKLEINVSYPFLLKVYNDFSNKVIDKETFVDVLELVQNFAWRRFIIGLPTNALNKIFMRLYEDVSLDSYLHSIQKALLIKKGSQRFPRDSEVLSALRDKDMYGIKSKNRTYFFERLENHENREKVLVDKNPAITIEHIFPQNPNPKWKLELGDEEFKKIRTNYLNTMANLTLSGNNGKLGNQSFIEKRDMNHNDKEQGYKYSRLWLNKYLASIDKWNLEEIENRYKILCQRFIAIWPFPIIDLGDTDFNEVNIFDAEDPTGKKLEYAIFFDQKLKVSTITNLYKEVMKTFLELQPETFFTSELGERVAITKSKSILRQALKLNETYYIESNLDSKSKVERIKLALSVYDCEDDLLIKYRQY